MALRRVLDLASKALPEVSEKPQVASDVSPKNNNVQDNYLIGLRGWFTLQSFIFVFLEAFLPGTVAATANTQGPPWQIGLKKSLSVLFWNGPLIYSAFIILSARSICIPFLRDPSKMNLASAIFRRGLRLWFPTAVGIALAKLILSQTDGIAFIDYFKELTGNVSIGTPYNLPNTLTYFNSVFNMFWLTKDFATSAGSLSFPSQLLWILSILFTQSYTVFMTMVIVPYTRRSWRVKASIGFVLTAWWVQSWAWYSITGLILADMVINMDFQTKAKRGIPLFPRQHIYLPVWVVYLICMAGGLCMQFLWTDWRPQDENAELRVHTGLYYSGGLNTEYDPSQPQPRDDVYLILAGLFFAVETYDWMQWMFKNPVFVYMGDRSLGESSFPLLE